MTRKFCVNCCCYTPMDDGTEWCLYDEDVEIKDVKLCPNEEDREDTVEKWNDMVRRNR